MVQKYNTKIHILVSGPLIKENWKHHLIKCTGETYLKYQDKSIYIDEAEKQRIKKNKLGERPKKLTKADIRNGLLEEEL